jgi:hypothetical protein
MLGLTTADVQRELLALLKVTPDIAAPGGAAVPTASSNGAPEVDKRAARRADTPATPSRAQAKGKPGKKAR